MSRPRFHGDIEESLELSMPVQASVSHSSTAYSRRMLVVCHTLACLSRPNEQVPVLATMYVFDKSVVPS